jgi:hypothetical protein
MIFNFRLLLKILFVILSAAYPVLIFYFLVIQKAPLRQLSLLIMALAMVAFLSFTMGNTAKKKVKQLLLYR